MYILIYIYIHKYIKKEKNKNEINKLTIDLRQFFV